MTSTPTTTDLDTELSAVNTILGSIGQSPLTTLNFQNPEVSFIYNLLTEANVDIQSEGWAFNKEEHITVSPDANGFINIPSDVLQYDMHDGVQDKSQRVVRRNGRLYDKVDHTDVFTKDMKVDAIYLYKFEDIPQPFKRLIVYTAASRAATQLVSNPQLVQMLQSKLAYARAVCMEYECNQGDHSYFNVPDDSSYNTFQPFHALRR